MGGGVQVNTIDKFSQYENSFESFNTNISQGTWKNKSFSFGLLGYYNLNENTLLRFKVGITNVNTSYHRDDRDEYRGTIPAPYRIIDETITQKRSFYVPGILWRLNINSFFQVHGGFELPINIYNNYIYKSDETDYDTTSTITLKANYITTAPGGYSAGVGAVAGFNVRVYKNISIGADFSSALLYLKLGGVVTQTVYQTIPVNETGTTHYLFKEEGFNYSGEKLSINAIYTF